LGGNQHGGRIKSYYVLFRDEIEIEAVISLQLSRDGSTSSYTKDNIRAGEESLVAVSLWYFSLLLENLPTQSFFSQPQSARGRSEGLLGCRIGKGWQLHFL
jgi:hypothetical protein